MFSWFLGLVRSIAEGIGRRMDKPDRAAPMMEMMLGLA
jgi:hypothetical protein